MEQIKENIFTTYEYKEIDTSGENLSFLLDSYECFGWIEDENMTAKRNSRKLYLKRDRRISNKAELTRLQRNFEACVDEIKLLEKLKTSMATAWSIGIGVVGTAFMAGSVFAVTAKPPHILLCIILAVPAFIGWIMPYFVYNKITASKTKQIVPLIEEKYDTIYELCEKGNKLCR